MTPRRSLFKKLLSKRSVPEPDTEEELKSKGNIYELQHYRLQKGHRVKIPKLLQKEQRIREISQRKLALTQELSQALLPIERSEDVEKELRELTEEYFIKECEIKLLYGSIDYGPLKRALELWRSHPQWYLHRTLTKDCADRGGCCGRSCGCCQARKADLSCVKFDVGHCTVECGCCQEARGCELTEKGKARMRELFSLDHQKNYPYYRKIMLASVQVFGLVHDSTENPFDFIDEPPEYEEK